MCERCRQIRNDYTQEEIAIKARNAIYMAELNMQQVLIHLKEFVEYGKVANNTEMIDLTAAWVLQQAAKDSLKLIADLHKAVEKQTNNPA